jgi:HD-GYP domain-containing protein (c-di-GMP phosphodiesterase class II)
VPLDLVPIALDHVLVKAMAGLPAYLEQEQDGVTHYILHCGGSARFSNFHRRRLQERQIRQIFMPREHHRQYRERVEVSLEAVATDESLTCMARAGLIYEMGWELLNEWMSGEVEDRLPRLEAVARAAAVLISSQRMVFAQFFACARHDDEIASHMTNVGIWMACLAHAMGENDWRALRNACMAGFLHDTGMRTLSRKMLYKPEEFTAEERRQMQTHAVAGTEYLKSRGVAEESWLRVALEHHERLDGSGYPAALKAEKIHPLAQMCAVVDSFEAMTSARPHKKRLKTIAEANGALQEPADKYDAGTVQAWIALLREASEQGAFREAVDRGAGTQNGGRRVHQRYAVECTTQLRVLAQNGESWVEGPPLNGRVFNISRSGVGAELKDAMIPGTYVRLSLKGKGSMQDRLLEGQVVRCRAIRGQHEVGIRFCTPGK